MLPLGDSGNIEINRISDNIWPIQILTLTESGQSVTQ